MLEWLFIIISLVFGIFGMMAFIWLLQGNAVSINLMTHEEFAGLPQEIKNLYKKAVLDIIVPAFHRSVANAYNESVKQKLYPAIEKRVLDEATAFAKNMETYINASIPSSSASTTTPTTPTTNSVASAPTKAVTSASDPLLQVYNPIRDSTTVTATKEAFTMFDDVMKRVSTLRN